MSPWDRRLKRPLELLSELATQFEVIVTRWIEGDITIHLLDFQLELGGVDDRCWGATD